MANQILFVFLSAIILSSCSQQNDFISTETIAQAGDEFFMYSAYQTGLDNYRIEFKAAVGGDTSKIFDYYINDALYTREHSFQSRVSGDTLIISTPFQSQSIYYKTKRGVTIKLCGNHM